jgi:hypothetical protein
MEPNALADYSQLLLIQMTTATNPQLFPDNPDLALRCVKGGIAGLLGDPKDLRTPVLQLA